MLVWVVVLVVGYTVTKFSEDFVGGGGHSVCLSAEERARLA